MRGIFKRHTFGSLYIRITRSRIGEWPSAQKGDDRDDESLDSRSAEFWHTTGSAVTAFTRAARQRAGLVSAIHLLRVVTELASVAERFHSAAQLDQEVGGERSSDEAQSPIGFYLQEETRMSTWQVIAACARGGRIQTSRKLALTFSAGLSPAKTSPYPVSV